MLFYNAKTHALPEKRRKSDALHLARFFPLAKLHPATRLIQVLFATPKVFFGLETVLLILLNLIWGNYCVVSSRFSIVVC
jgi:hypothetical protein